MSSALLVMDVQRRIVESYVDDPGLLDRLREAVAAARGAGVPVVYVQVAFRPGFPEVSDANKTFAALRGQPGFTLDAEGAQIHDAVAPREGDVVVVKKRVSAFAGSDLEVVLRSLGVNTLVLSGIATSGVVLSTLREAADRDYALVVLADCCGDGDPEVHRVLLEKVFPRQADVTTVADWARGLT